MTRPRDTSVVAGAAIVGTGRLLAARRVAPPSLAGGWELPGGKVEPGESAEQACVRECAEELGVIVTVRCRLGPDLPIAPGWVLRVHEARLLDGEPLPGADHDALRWLGPEELEEVGWLSADRPLLPRLRARLLDGQPLAGGNVGGAVRIGATVRRARGPWTPAVHALLRWLREAGFADVPAVMGSDERGREVLSYLPGDVSTGEVPVPDAVLVAAMSWLARYHAAVRGFRPAGAIRWRNVTRALADGEIVCHHDFAPYNLAVDGDRVAGVFDWDMAGPGRPLDDVAFAAWNFVPLWLELPPAESARRLRLLCEAYGDADPHRVLALVPGRIEAAGAVISAGQRAGDPGMSNLRQVGEPQRTRLALAALRDRLPAIGAALRTGRG